MRSMTYSDAKKFLASWQGMCIQAVLVLAVLICVPAWQVERVRARLDKPDAYQLASLEDEYRRTLAQILAGCGLLVGLYWTSRRVKATEDNVSVAEEGHITERFTRAIEQLGHAEMAIRLGGIYALERLAKDSEKDHGPIMEVLTAYVREKATKEGEYVLLPVTAEKPTTDIQAILTVLGRRKTTGPNRRIGGGSVEGGVPGQWQTSGKGRGPDSLDLNHTHLVGAELISADLTTANLAGANLSGATLVGANLSMATLAGANLYEAKLYEADLTMADLNAADLSGATLDAAELILAALTGAKNLTAEQVLSAKNWRAARLPDSLKHLNDLPEPPPA